MTSRLPEAQPIPDTRLADYAAARRGTATADLFAAIKDDDVDAVLVAVDGGADVGERNAQGLTPLAAGVVGGRVEIVRALLDSGAELLDEAAGGQRVLGFAVSHAWRHPNLETVGLLLERGTDPNGADTHTGLTALHHAARIGPFTAASESATRLLLAHGAKVSARDAEGRTPLHVAVKTIAAETVRILLVAGADPDAKASDGTTPLVAVVSEFSAMLAAGADVAEASAFQVERITSLLEAGADPAVAAGERTALSLALQQRDYPEAAIVALLDAGADASRDVRDGDHPIPLVAFAFLYGRSDTLITKLIAKGSNPRTPIARWKNLSMLDVAEHKRPELAAAIRALG